MRYHSILIEEMPEEFEVTARSKDDQAIMGIQHKLFRFMACSIIQKVLERQMTIFYSEFYRESKVVEEHKMKEIEKLANFEDLSSVEMTDVIERIVTGRVTEAQIASLLLALKMKGENT